MLRKALDFTNTKFEECLLEMRDLESTRAILIVSAVCITPTD